MGIPKLVIYGVLYRALDAFQAALGQHLDAF